MTNTTPEARRVGPYDVPCPACGASQTEPCWDLRGNGNPNMYPHADRQVTMAKANAVLAYFKVNQ